MGHLSPSYVANLIILIGVLKVFHVPRTVSTQVRVVGGNSNDSGLVEILAGEWVMMPTVYFGYNEAVVVCRMLGYDASYVSYIYEGLLFGTNARYGITNDLQCNGTETDLALCPGFSSGWQIGSRRHQSEATVSCAKTQLRLMDGDNPHSGRVEYLFYGTWHSYCGRDFDFYDAEVICNSLGFSTSGVVRAFTNSHYGQGSGNAVITRLRCKGNERDIKFCQPTMESSGSCDHRYDAGVTCGATKIRLVDGPTNTSGRVEVYHAGKWGTICGYEGFSNRNAKIVCDMLGISTTNPFSYSLAYYGQGNNHILISHLTCDGSEPDIAACGSDDWAVSGLPHSYCSHLYDVGVNCDGVTTIRLADGMSPQSGRVEVLHNGHWGTIADTYFDNHALTVICRMLGYTYSSKSFYRSGSYYGQGLGEIIVDKLQCDGSETDIGHCSATWWPSTSANDPHVHDIGVSCDGLIPIKLVGGENSTGSGRVELLHDGMYGTICSRAFDRFDLNVVCRMLGFENVPKTAYWRPTASYAQGLGEVIVSDLTCNGIEDNLGQCGGHWPANSCDHADDVYVNCLGEPEQLRLVDGNNQYSGRVEILHDGRWSTICDDDFDRADAVVICRILKFQNPEKAVAFTRSHFGTVNDTVEIVMTNLQCNGLESNLGQCSPTWSKSYCSHSQDIGVDCCPGCQPQVIVG